MKRKLSEELKRILEDDYIVEEEESQHNETVVDGERFDFEGLSKLLDEDDDVGTDLEEGKNPVSNSADMAMEGLENFVGTIRQEEHNGKEITKDGLKIIKQVGELVDQLESVKRSPVKYVK